MINSKLNDYIVGTPVGYCPRCNVYVKSTDQGVECPTCVAYWHYSCANTSEEEVMKLGKKEFYCEQHRKTDVGPNDVVGVPVGNKPVKVASNEIEHELSTDFDRNSVVGEAGEVIDAIIHACSDDDDDDYTADNIINIKIAPYVLNTNRFFKNRLKEVCLLYTSPSPRDS